jgi:hypothetical protein
MLSLRPNKSAFLLVGLFFLLVTPLMAHNTIVAFPEPLRPLSPLGSQIYERDTNGKVESSGDTYSYTLPIDAGQTVTLAVVPHGGTLQPTVSLFDPSNSLIGTATAASSGQQSVLETVPASTKGTYAFVVSGANATAGEFEIKVILNAALDAPSVIDNSTLATAQDISASSISSCMPTYLCDRLAVNGTLAGRAHYYSFSLSAGEAVSLAVSFFNLASGSLELLDGSGNVLATGTAGAQNVTESIREYLLLASGTYYIQVSAAGSSDYNLLVTERTDFELTPNTQSNPQALGFDNAIIGYIGKTYPIPAWFSFNVNAGDNLLLSVTSPSDQGGEFHNNLIPQIDLYDTSFQHVATSFQNAILWTALTTGTYRFSVSSVEKTTGEYAVTVQGNTGAVCPPFCAP